MGQGVSLSLAGASRTSANLATVDKGDITLNNAILIRETSMLDCDSFEIQYSTSVRICQTTRDQN